ncbi:hypothetical protein F4808DRAFT_410648 [Astrocystis sublimbata]|nr:hypothetical protein F4808DRAFT_410648 [Astrocystis sublimbata]
MFNLTAPQGGWGAGAAPALPNPFKSATPPPGNPFSKPPANPFQSNNTTAAAPAPAPAPATNPFLASSANANPFSTTTTPAFKRSASPTSAAQLNKGAAVAKNRFGQANGATFAPALQPSKPSTNGRRRSSPKPFNNAPKQVAEYVQPAWPNRSKTPPGAIHASSDARKRRAGSREPGNVQPSGISSAPGSMAGKRTFGLNGVDARHAPSNKLSSTSNKQHDGRSRELASKIQQQLLRDRIKPPQWPSNPGSSSQRREMENFRESYKSYREKARKSLIKAGLIDDPDQRRTLQQALDFRGTSEEMCPEWEKITRIIEYDVRNPEKAPDGSGDLVADPSLMVKRLARSAAGQDAPLPMDVRSFATLRKTLDYLIDDLIPNDSLLPSKHNFLWDRTRAIRIDLSVQKFNLTTDERADLVYCLETIARFHVTALHLLSQEGFAAEDFSEQQEIEQLGKTLISLKELYDDCVEQGIECENEAEFRGYYIVFNARNPSVKETVEGWGTRMWNTDGIRTAMCLVESLQNTWSLQGPLNPYAPTEIALGAAAMFFSIIASPEISYTMACFAEIHFNEVRRSILQILRKAYTRPRDGPKDITPAFLREQLRLDTEDEAVNFAEKHGIIFGRDGGQQYAILNTRQSIEEPRIPHLFSRNIVEHKRSGRSLPEIIHQTVYHQSIYRQDRGHSNISEEVSLFVTDEENTSFDTSGFTNGGKTYSTASTVASSPPVNNNAKSPHNDASKLSQPQATSSSSLSSIFQPASTSTPSNTTPSLFTGSPSTAAPTHGQQPQTRSSLFSQPNGSVIGSNMGLQNNTNEHKLPNTDTSSTSLQPSKAGTENNVPAASNVSTSNSIFSFLDKKEPSVAQAPAKSGSPLGPSTKLSLFSSSNGGGKFLGVASAVPTAVSSVASETSTARNRTPDVSSTSSSSLFKQTPPSLTPNNDITSAVTNPAISRSEQQANATGQPKLTTGQITLSPGSEREKSNTDQQTLSSVAPAPAMPKKDLMGDFTRWFVLADKGLLTDKLEAVAVEQILRNTWAGFQAAEKERVRKEEDDRSWAEALKFRHYSLKVTYFYRWRDLTRKRRVIKRIKLEKEKARKWNSPQSVTERENAERAKKEKAIQEAKELVERRTMEQTQETSRLRESTQSQQSFEEALLATGVFDGLQDERAAARRATQDEDINSEDDILPAEKLRLRSENQRRKKHGLNPLKRFPAAKVHKDGSKTAKIRALASGKGRDSLSMSTSSLRNSTFCSSYRSSMGFNKSRVSKSRPNVSDPYWRMKANGLVQMPNGEYLHESLALPMLREGKRFPGLGDYGLPPPQQSFTPSHSPPAGVDLLTTSVSTDLAASTPNDRTSRSPMILNGITYKRKRKVVDDDDKDLNAYRNEAVAAHKRAKSSDRAGGAAASGDQDFLDSIASLLNQVDSAVKSSSN